MRPPRSRGSPESRMDAGVLRRSSRSVGVLVLASQAEGRGFEPHRPLRPRSLPPCGIAACSVSRSVGVRRQIESIRRRAAPESSPRSPSRGARSAGRSSGSTCPSPATTRTSRRQPRAPRSRMCAVGGTGRASRSQAASSAGYQARERQFSIPRWPPRMPGRATPCRPWAGEPRLPPSPSR